MLKETVGFCKVEVAGVPPAIVQLQDVGVFVELSVKLTVCPIHVVEADVVKDATGTVLAASFRVYQIGEVQITSPSA